MGQSRHVSGNSKEIAVEVRARSPAVKAKEKEQTDAELSSLLPYGC